MKNIDAIIQELEAQFEQPEEKQVAVESSRDRWEYEGAISFLSVNGQPIDGDNIYVGGAQLRLDDFNDEGDMWDQPYLDGLLGDHFRLCRGRFGDRADNRYRIIIEKVEQEDA